MKTLEIKGVNSTTPSGGKQSNTCKVRHRRVFEGLRDSGIGADALLTVHLQQYYQRLGFKEGDFPEAEIL